MSGSWSLNSLCGQLPCAGKFLRCGVRSHPGLNLTEAARVQGPQDAPSDVLPVSADCSLLGDRPPDNSVLFKCWMSPMFK